MTRFAKRIDANQPAIVKALRERGVKVYVASAAGKGMADLVCFYTGMTILAELKDGAKSPSRRRLTQEQTILHDLARSAGIIIPVFTSVDDALSYFGFAS
jgi:Holliday junction resolvase